MRLTLAEVSATLGVEPALPAGVDMSGVVESVETDTRVELGGRLFLALRGERFDGHDFCRTAVSHGAVALVVDRERAEGLEGIGAAVFGVDDTLEALMALGRFVRFKVGPKVAAITGSFGKTTTKEIAVALLGGALGAGCRTGGADRVLYTLGNLNNRIGMPKTLLRATGCERLAVLELGISLPGEMAHLTRGAAPDVALVTGVGAAHTEGLGLVASVAEEKLKIALGIRDGGTLLIPHENEYLAAPGWLHELAGRRNIGIKTFGFVPEADYEGRGLESLDGASSVFEVEGRTIRVPLPGLHNAENALAAWALVSELGEDPAEGLHRLAAMEPAPMRGEVRRGKNGATLLVDCYNANPRAMEAALDTLGSLAGGARKVAVLGEMKELGVLSVDAHRETGVLAAEAGVDELLIFGEEAAPMAEGAISAGIPAERVRRFGSRDALAGELKKIVRGGDWVLVKGSRSARLDEVADALTAGRDAAGASGDNVTTGKAGC